VRPVDKSSVDVASFEELYQQLWWPMVRLAYGLVDERAAAEDVVQDAFAALYRQWQTLRDRAAAIAYLRVSVVNAARSVLRRRGTARRHLHRLISDSESAADQPILLATEHAMVREAFAGLPQRQREVLTLRYVAELDDVAIAAATGLSLGGVRAASSRGLATLRRRLGETS
jgi:RNA polymerase sigma factor (sigma-70 family)